MLEGVKIKGDYGKGNNNRNTLENYLWEDKPEAESKSQEELSQAMQPMRTHRR